MLSSVATLCLAVALLAALPALYRLVAVLERFAVVLERPAENSPIAALLPRPAPVEDEAAFVRRRDDYLQKFGVHLPPPPPRGVEVDTSSLTPVKEIR